MHTTQDQLRTLRIFRAIPVNNLKHLVSEVGLSEKHYSTHLKRAWGMTVYTYRTIGLSEKVRIKSHQVFAT